MRVTKGRIKATKIAVVLPDDERYLGLKNQSVLCQQALNFLWRNWLAYHTLAETEKKIREHIARVAEWAADKRPTKEKGKKPKWPFKPFPESDWAFSHIKRPMKKRGQPDSEPVQSPPDLQNDLYHRLQANYPELHTETILALLNKWSETVKSRKAVRGSLPGWAAIILGNEGAPTFTKPQPIPFTTKGHTKLEQDDDGTLWLKVSLERGEEGAIIDRIKLILNSKGAWRIRGLVNKIADDTYPMCGSQLMFQDKKPFLVLSYRLQDEERPELDENRTLFIRPGSKRCWTIRIGDQSKSFGWVGGNGHHIAGVRRLINRERKERQESYKWARGGRRGHGQKRAEAVKRRLQTRWNQFVKTCNQTAARQAVNIAIKNQCGRIVYLQPTGKHADSCYIASSGRKIGDRYDRTTWEHFQFGDILSKAAPPNMTVSIEKREPKSKAKPDPDTKTSTKRGGRKRQQNRKPVTAKN